MNSRTRYSCCGSSHTSINRQMFSCSRKTQGFSISAGPQDRTGNTNVIQRLENRNLSLEELHRFWIVCEFVLCYTLYDREVHEHQEHVCMPSIVGTHLDRSNGTSLNFDGLFDFRKRPGAESTTCQCTGLVSELSTD